MRRRWPLIVGALVLVLVVAGVAYKLLGGSKTVAPHIAAPEATAVIGEGDGAVAVGADGALLTWLPLSGEEALPRLPLDSPPKSGKLGGHMLEQARVLGAAPKALRKFAERSYYGESGVDVVLTSGIELRFGDDAQAAQKWKSAAAVLANPELEELGYVDLHSPTRPATGGSGHALPSVP